jgi:hypothetical protein
VARTVRQVCCLKIDFEPLPDSTFHASVKPIIPEPRIIRATLSSGFLFRDEDLLRDGDDSIGFVRAQTRELTAGHLGREVRLAPGDATMMLMGATGGVSWRESCRHGQTADGDLGGRWTLGVVRHPYGTLVLPAAVPGAGAIYRDCPYADPGSADVRLRLARPPDSLGIDWMGMGLQHRIRLLDYRAIRCISYCPHTRSADMVNQSLRLHAAS